MPDHPDGTLACLCVPEKKRKLMQEGPAVSFTQVPTSGSLPLLVSPWPVATPHQGSLCACCPGPWRVKLQLLLLPEPRV